MKRLLYIFIPLILSGCGESEQVKKVKSFVYDSIDSSITVGNALDNRPICKSTDWKAFKDARNRDIVEYTCNFRLEEPNNYLVSLFDASIVNMQNRYVDTNLDNFNIKEYLVYQSNSNYIQKNTYYKNYIDIKAMDYIYSQARLNAFKKLDTVIRGYDYETLLSDIRNKRIDIITNIEALKKELLTTELATIQPELMYSYIEDQLQKIRFRHKDIALENNMRSLEKASNIPPEFIAIYNQQALKLISLIQEINNLSLSETKNYPELLMEYNSKISELLKEYEIFQKILSEHPKLSAHLDLDFDFKYELTNIIKIPEQERKRLELITERDSEIKVLKELVSITDDEYFDYLLNRPIYKNKVLSHIQGHFSNKDINNKILSFRKSLIAARDMFEEIDREASKALLDYRHIISFVTKDDIYKKMIDPSYKITDVPIAKNYAEYIQYIQDQLNRRMKETYDNIIKPHNDSLKNTISDAQKFRTERIKVFEQKVQWSVIENKEPTLIACQLMIEYAGIADIISTVNPNDCFTAAYSGNYVPSTYNKAVSEIYRNFWDSVYD